jgi:hypothetical protein
MVSEVKGQQEGGTHAAARGGGVEPEGGFAGVGVEGAGEGSG